MSIVLEGGEAGGFGVEADGFGVEAVFFLLFPPAGAANPILEILQCICSYWVSQKSLHITFFLVSEMLEVCGEGPCHKLQSFTPSKQWNGSKKVQSKKLCRSLLGLIAHGLSKSYPQI